MAERIAIILTKEDGTGKLVPNKTPTTVELWEHGGIKKKDLSSGITNNGDGTYAIDPTGLTYDQTYDLKVDGIIEDEWKEFKLPTQDLVYTGKLDNVTIGLVSGKVAVLNDGIGKAQIAAEVAGSGLKQNTDGSLSPDPDGETVEIDGSDQLAVKSGVFAAQDDLTEAQGEIAALADLIGTLDFQGFSLLENLLANTVEYALKALHKQIMANFHAITNGTAIFAHRKILGDHYAASGVDGNEAAALVVYTQSGMVPKVKERGLYVKRPGDKYLVLSCRANVIDGGDYAQVTLELMRLADDSVINNYSSTNMSDDSGWDDIVTVLDVSNYTIGEEFEVRVKLNQVDGVSGRKAQMYAINVDALGIE